LRADSFAASFLPKAVAAEEIVHREFDGGGQSIGRPERRRKLHPPCVFLQFRSGRLRDLDFDPHARLAGAED
jgi:hypothetical protein